MSADTVSIQLPVEVARRFRVEAWTDRDTLLLKNQVRAAVEKHDAEHKRFRAEPDPRHSWTVWTRNLCVARFYDDDGSWDHRAEAEALAERLNLRT